MSHLLRTRQHRSITIGHNYSGSRIMVYAPTTTVVEDGRRGAGSLWSKATGYTLYFHSRGGAAAAHYHFILYTSHRAGASPSCPFILYTSQRAASAAHYRFILYTSHCAAAAAHLLLLHTLHCSSRGRRALLPFTIDTLYFHLSRGRRAWLHLNTLYFPPRSHHASLPLHTL